MVWQGAVVDTMSFYIVPKTTTRRMPQSLASYLRTSIYDLWDVVATWGAVNLGFHDVASVYE